MKTISAWFWAVLLVLGGSVVVGCVQVPDVPDEPLDGGTDSQDDTVVVVVCDGTPIECACANLCLLTCSECSPNCDESINKILIDRIMSFDLVCVSEAATKQEARMCPAIECK